ncbi:hypothetical protein [Haloplanus halobius]|uniref:hypothetical protein n=1 Tax=Haloplanus halobius TaxID=2934938 RepID=UPI0020100237|nr:hypothetical protein [Haloplanus sp. XH21]
MTPRDISAHTACRQYVVGTLDRGHHAFLALLAFFVAIALYRFTTHLLANLPW